MTGIAVSTISHLTTAFPKRGNGNHHDHVWSSWANELRATGALFTDLGFARTITADTTTVTDGLSGESVSLEMSMHYLILANFPRRFQDVGYDAFDSTPLSELHSRMFLHFCQIRKAGLTNEGKLGLFPDVSQSGDVVVALFGGTTLYVIRPVHDGRYRFIGECYIDQMMHGQVMDIVAERGQEVEKFTFV